MKIGIDARLYGLKHAGIGRYIQNLVNHLALVDQDTHYTLLVADQKDIDPLPHNFTTITANIRHYTWAEQTQLLHLINKLDVDFFHFPHFNIPLLYRKPYVVTIHDLLWHKKIGLNATTLSPATYLLKYSAYRATIRNAIIRSESIITPTDKITDSITKHFPVESTKIHITHEAADPAFSKPSAHLSSTLKAQISSLKSPFVVYTGSLYPHKNVNTLIDAINGLDNIKLVIVSARNVFQQQTKDYVTSIGALSKVKFLGFLPDPQLAALYQQALALVLPSKSEGFGLTGLEAMTAGLPVISSDNPVLREVYGPAALYTDTSASHNIGQSIQKLAKSPQQCQRLIKAGHQQTKKYTWEKTAKQTLNVYKQVSKSQSISKHGLS